MVIKHWSMSITKGDGKDISYKLEKLIIKPSQLNSFYQKQNMLFYKFIFLKHILDGCHTQSNCILDYKVVAVFVWEGKSLKQVWTM